MIAFGLNVGKRCFHVRAYPPAETGVDGASNWRLTPQEWPGVPPDPFSNRIHEILSNMGIHRVFVPNVKAASGRILSDEEFTGETQLGDISIRWNPAPADGVFLRYRYVFAMLQGGCSLILASGGHYAISAHAGLRSLAHVDSDPGADASARTHESVVLAIVDAFGKMGVKPKDIAMHMLFSLPPYERQFNNEKFGRANRDLADWSDRRWPGGMKRLPDGSGIRVDLPLLFMTQAKDAGVGMTLVSESLRQHPDMPHTYDGGDPNLRSLVIAFRE